MYLGYLELVIARIFRHFPFGLALAVLNFVFTHCAHHCSSTSTYGMP